MTMPLRADPRLRSIEWHDLRKLTRRQKLNELTLSLPWLVASILLFQLGWIVPGMAAAFFFFLTGLRQAHGAQHYSIGIDRRYQDWLLSALSVLMLSSMHALQVTHMHHHRHTLDESDMEAATARMAWWKALAAGPWFILMLNASGYRMAKAAKRRWIRAEFALMALWVGVVVAWAPAGFKWFLVAMAAGETMTGFFAVWTVHHDCDREHQLARTQRGWWKNFISYEMFYHVEHHLFPDVPTPRLPELAARIDQALPGLARHQVF
jgi:fatty acid desaturase